MYVLSPPLFLMQAAAVIEGIAEGCRQANCGLIGGETAEMPSMYKDGEYDLAGFSVGAVPKGKVLPRPLAVGDAILGLRSSGVHSNGFSLLRRIVELKELSYSDPAPFSEGQKTLGEEFLVPTRIYVRALMPLIRAGIVKALAHITGGGLPENLPRVLDAGLTARLRAGDVADGSANGDSGRGSRWKLPGIFRWLRDAGGLEQAEMFRTFNCGVGMVVVVSPEHVAQAIELMLEAGEHDVLELGLIEERAAPDAPQVVIDGDL